MGDFKEIPEDFVFTQPQKNYLFFKRIYFGEATKIRIPQKIPREPNITSFIGSECRCKCYNRQGKECKISRSKSEKNFELEIQAVKNITKRNYEVSVRL